jgi:hypothetical protein
MNYDWKTDKSIMNYDWQTELKLALNEALWAKAPGNTPLGVLEEAACAALTIVNRFAESNKTQ